MFYVCDGRRHLLRQGKYGGPKRWRAVRRRGRGGGGGRRRAAKMAAGRGGRGRRRPARPQWRSFSERGKRRAGRGRPGEGPARSLPGARINGRARRPVVAAAARPRPGREAGGRWRGCAAASRARDCCLRDARPLPALPLPRRPLEGAAGSCPARPQLPRTPNCSREAPSRRGVVARVGASGLLAPRPPSAGLDPAPAVTLARGVVCCGAGLGAARRARVCELRASVVACHRRCQRIPGPLVFLRTEWRLKIW
ncbi:putative uncharacterized protein FLJ46214 [Macaca nemestrina]|uniref:putative uncharacterized protein FLJ46214 n=1 Tax=Macaca nemestrina TaxID=9545 RepID=UPI0039B873AE